MKEAIVRVVLYIINFIVLYTLVGLLADAVFPRSSMNGLSKAYGAICIAFPLSFIIAEKSISLFQKGSSGLDE